MNEFTHVDKDNQPGMVDVTAKANTAREATARCVVVLGKELLKMLNDDDIQSKKGPVFQTAVIAGTLATKKTWDLIPFCHPIPLEKCKIKISAISEDSVEVLCTCATNARTGIEMEALTGANVAALTIYDMCKAVSKAIIISECKLLSKTGGKSDFKP